MLNHKTRKKWIRGGGGLNLHTILLDPRDPRRMHIDISAVGTINTKDGRGSWKFQNRNVLAGFSQVKYPVYGECTHKIAVNPSDADIIFQQNHCGCTGATVPERTGWVSGTTLPGASVSHGRGRQRAEEDLRRPHGRGLLPDSLGGHFGTRTGRLYASRNQGEHWEGVADTLPPVLSVSATALQGRRIKRQLRSTRCARHRGALPASRRFHPGS